MLADKLKTLVRGEIITDPQALHGYSHDASIFEIVPEVVVAPRDSADLAALVNFATAERVAGADISLTARAAGTCMSGGSLSSSIVLDFKQHFNHIKSVSKEQATTEPGVYFRDLEARMKNVGSMLPSFPASRGLCTIGGMVANNSAGEKTLSYGQTANFVEKLKMVCSNGQEYTFSPITRAELESKCRQNTFEGVIYKEVRKLIETNRKQIAAARPTTSKNSAGYNLWDVWDEAEGTFDITKLLVGSQGTLGLITEIGLKLAPIKSHRHTLTIFLYDLEHLVETINLVLRFDPEAFECFDNETLRLGIKYLPDVMRTLEESWPEFKKRTGVILPKLTLLVELAAEDEAKLHSQILDLTTELAAREIPHHLSGSPAEAEAYWTVRHESFNLLRLHAEDKQCAPFIDDIIVKPEHLPKFLPELEAILSKYKKQIAYTVAGHIGDGNFHILPLVDLADPNTREAIPKIMDEVFALVWRFHGSTAAEHNDGLIRGQYLGQQFGEEMLSLFKQVKHIFDPHNIFNPHKKVGATAEYSFKYLKETPKHSYGY